MSEFTDWRSISVFRDLSDRDLELVREIFTSRCVAAGQNLITEGEDGDELFILIQGKVRISKSMLLGNISVPLLAMDDPRKVLAVLDDSQYPLFGEIALIDRDTRSATIHVLEDSEFLVTDRDRFFELARREPALGFHLLLAVTRRLAATVRRNNQELVKLTTALALALDRASR
jgi:CRP/FNR family cyclic AMP-dependent transcriptional regulator